MTDTAPEDDLTTTTDVDGDDLADFDAFWRGQNRKGKRARIAGEVVQLPPSLPLQFELEARKLQHSKREQDVHKLLTILGFPEDAQDRWAEAGMDLEQFQVLLAWAPRYIAGQNVTLAQVAAEVAEAQAADAAKGNPTKRRKS